MATIGFNKVIRVRMTEMDYSRAVTHTRNNPNRYRDLSHFVRSAIIKKINDEVEIK